MQWDLIEAIVISIIYLGTLTGLILVMVAQFSGEDVDEFNAITSGWKCPRCGYQNASNGEVCAGADGRCGHKKV